MARKRTIDNLSIRPVDGDRQREAVIDLVGKVFCHGRGYYGMVDHCHNGYFDGSCYVPAASRIALDGETIVSHVGVWKYTMRIGSARVTSGGIGCVATDACYRGRGVMREVFGQTMQAMRDQGYDCSLLFGINNYYAKFGYAPAWPKSGVEVPAEELGRLGPCPWSLRKGKLVELIRGEGPLGRLYEEEFAETTGSPVRPLFTKDLRGWDLHELRDKSKRLRGYVVHETQPDRLAVHELAGANSPADSRAVLAAVAKLAGTAGRRTVKFKTRRDTGAIEQLRRLCSVETCTYERDGGPMFAVLNLRSLLGKMCDELSRRVAGAALSRGKTTLTLRSLGQSATLEIAPGRVRLAERVARGGPAIAGGPDLARLLIGAESPAAIFATSDCKPSAGAAELAAVLFPRRSPWQSPLDFF